MNIIINKSQLENVLNNSLNFLEKKDFSQITSHILLIAKNNILIIKATDYEIGIELEIKNVDIKEEGIATANGKKIFDIVKILNDTETTIKTKNNHLIIKQQKSNYKLPMFNALEFPIFPTIQNKEKFEIDPKLFIKALKNITPAIDTSSPKTELHGCLIDIEKNQISFVATDTKRLAIIKIKNEQIKENLQILIPKKAILEIQKLFFNELNIYLDQNILIAKSSNFTLYTKLINGKFPNYQRIIPTNTKIKLELNKNEIVEKIKQVAIISKDIKMTISQNEIIIENLNKENEEAKSIIECQNSLTEEICIKTNSKYITDFLLNIDEQKFILWYNDPSLPFVLENENFKTIIIQIT